MSETTAMSLKPLLIELGTEELPTLAIDELAIALAKGVTEGLTKRGVALADEPAKVYATPRRLAVLIPGVAAAQPDQTLERRGPALSAGLDAAGLPTRALLGFAASCGVDVALLDKLETDKGAWFVYRSRQAGRPTAGLVPEILDEALKALPIPKPMRWGAHAYAFVRPAHWLVILHGDRVVEASVFGLASGRESRGHRFHHPQAVPIASAESYLDALREAKVLADPEDREKQIKNAVFNAQGRLKSDTGRQDLTCHIDQDNLTEVRNLVEWPVAITCSFDKDFLRVPKEALVLTMQKNQKFFPVVDGKGHLTEHFVGIANIESREPAEIRKGYERVIRPRFADARFFFDEDLKTPLAAHQDALRNVTYQQSLGSLWDKSVRVAELARAIANRIGVDAGLATRAAALAKCDLLTRMVGEFPELQGIMGRYYAEANGENAEVARALDEFYAPRFADDFIAAGKIGQVLAVAERLDTLAGIFAVGLKPSGNKDPFALRRAALGLARTIIEGGLELDLTGLLIEAIDLLPDGALQAGLPKAKDGSMPALDRARRRAELVGQLGEFILDRLRGYFLDRGVSADVFQAVTAPVGPVISSTSLDLLDLARRIEAVVAFAGLADAEALAAANKRIANILRQVPGEHPVKVDAGLLEAGAEQDLHAAIQSTVAAAAPLITARDYVGLLRLLAGLREPVDRFFDGVMVMAEDAGKRHNRLAMLGTLRALFLRVADVSLLQVI